MKKRIMVLIALVMVLGACPNNTTAAVEQELLKPLLGQWRGSNTIDGTEFFDWLNFHGMKTDGLFFVTRYAKKNMVDFKFQKGYTYFKITPSKIFVFLTKEYKIGDADITTYHYDPSRIETITYTINGDTLTLNWNNKKMVYKKL